MLDENVKKILDDVRTKKIELENRVQVGLSNLFLKKSGLSVGDIVMTEFQHNMLYDRNIHVKFTVTEGVICKNDKGIIFIKSKNTLTTYKENYGKDVRRNGKFQAVNEYKTTSIFNIKKFI